MGEGPDGWLVKIGVRQDSFDKRDSYSTLGAGKSDAANSPAASPSEPGFFGQMEEKVRALAGAGPKKEEVQRLKTDLENGQRAIQTVATVADLKPEYVEKLNHAAEKLGAVAEGIDKGLEIAEGLEAILEIHEALKVLNDPRNLQPGSRAAAKAFGQLFHGAGTFVKKLPKPFNEYAPIFEGCLNFFSDIQRLNDPETGPHADLMREAMKDL